MSGVHEWFFLFMSGVLDAFSLCMLGAGSGYPPDSQPRAPAPASSRAAVAEAHSIPYEVRPHEIHDSADDSLDTVRRKHMIHET